MIPEHPRDGRELRQQAEALLQQRKQGSRSPATTAEAIRILHELEVHQVELELQNLELQRTRIEIEAVSERYAELYEFAPVGYLTLSADGKIQDVNQAAARLLGRGRAQLVDRRLDSCVSEADLPKFHAYLRQLAGAQPVSVCELEMMAAGEVPVPVALTANRSPETAEVRLTLVDLTEHRREEAMQRRQAALLNACSEAISVRDLEHRVNFWNQGAETLYGRNAGEALGSRMTEWEQLDQDGFGAACHILLLNGVWMGEQTLRCEGAAPRVIFCHWTLLRNQDGRPVEILAVESDVTAQKLLEARFLHAQRVQTLGRLAGGVAHDLNNLLTPILLVARQLHERVVDRENEEMVTTIEDCVGRAAEVIKQLLSYARSDPGPRTAVDLAQMISDLRRIAGETFPKNIRTGMDVVGTPWPVQGNATQLHQALMNLCVNARDAMPEGGALMIRAQNRSLEASFPTDSADFKPGSYVCVSVTDTGTGISAEHLEKIFDPFFTTKEIGQGTGLGLATVLGIVRGHGGFVQVRSRVGSGTTFEVYLPSSVPASVSVPRAPVLPPRPEAGTCILVVDDEDIVRSVLSHALTSKGYRVLAAADGRDALNMYAQHAHDIRGVVTDLMMPGMSGQVLINHLRHADPKLPIVVITGQAQWEGDKVVKLPNDIPVLPKPFAIVDLLERVNRVVHGT